MHRLFSTLELRLELPSFIHTALLAVAKFSLHETLLAVMVGVLLWVQLVHEGRFAPSRP